MQKHTLMGISEMDMLVPGVISFKNIYNLFILSCAFSMPGPVRCYRELCTWYQRTPTNWPLSQEVSTTKGETTSCAEKGQCHSKNLLSRKY